MRATDSPLPAAIKLPAEDQKFADLARTLQARYWTFDEIFAALCRAALTNVKANPKLNIQDQARAIWGGMWLWTCQGIEPLPLFHAGGLAVLRGRADGKYDHGYDLVTLQQHYAQHFIAGGMFEAYFGAGREAGVRKERLDSVTGDYFDYNKVAVTSMGARWVDVAVEGDAQHTKHWLELWASGQYTLSKSLPRLHWRSLPPFVDSDPKEVRVVEDEVDAAIKFPGEAPVSISSPAAPTDVSLPAQLQKYMMLLGGLYTNDETLVGAVESLLQQRMRQTDSVQPNPALIVISYRRREGKATDVVVQLFRRPEQTTEVVEAHTRLASRLGPEVLRPLDEWLNLIREPQIVYLGPEEEAGLRQRAFDAALQADLTLMHEQTIEPLHLIILIADTKQLLPQSLSHRVRSVIVEAVLAYGEWQGRIHLVTADPDVAEELEWFLASLREMAMSVARISASVATHPAARRALEAVTLTAQGKEVLATGSVPSPLGMEVATRLTGWAAEQVAWKDQPKMVTICQRGQTQQVRPLELSASLASGAHLGPCH